jgi:hypothetical protein
MATQVYTITVTVNTPNYVTSEDIKYAMEELLDNIVDEYSDLSVIKIPDESIT